MQELQNTNKEQHNAITACWQCHLACQEVLAYHGDERGGNQLSPQHIKRMLAAIEMCRTTADMIAIHAPLLDQLCDITARIVEQCATSCAAIDLPSMRRCVSACRHCVEALYEESSKIKKAS